MLPGQQNLFPNRMFEKSVLMKLSTLPLILQDPSKRDKDAIHQEPGNIRPSYAGNHEIEKRESLLIQFSL